MLEGPSNLFELHLSNLCKDVKDLLTSVNQSSYTTVLERTEVSIFMAEALDEREFLENNPSPILPNSMIVYAVQAKDEHHD